MNSFAYVIFISILFSCLGQVAADLYLPSLPAIAAGLSSTISLVQTTVASYMLGYTMSFFLYGPLSDAVGRKKPLIAGLILFFIGNITCVFTHSIYILIAGRFLQGLGAGAGTVLGGTITRDLLSGNGLARAFSYLGIANIVAIASAPFFGGYLQHFFGWRASFWFLFIYALIAFSVSTMFLQETNQHRTKENLRYAKIKENLLLLFGNHEFVSYITTLFAVYGGILAWITLGPVFLQNTLGLSPISFGRVALGCGFFYAVGSFFSSQLTEKYGIHKMVNLAAGIGLLSGLFLLIGACYFINVFTLLIPVFAFIFSAGIIFPNAYAGALLPFQKITGIAGAIARSTQILGGVISSEIISLLPDTTAVPMAVIFVLSSSWILYMGKYRKKVRSL